MSRILTSTLRVLRWHCFMIIEHIITGFKQETEVRTCLHSFQGHTWAPSWGGELTVLSVHLAESIRLSPCLTFILSSICPIGGKVCVQPSCSILLGPMEVGCPGSMEVSADSLRNSHLDLHWNLLGILPIPSPNCLTHLFSLEQPVGVSSLKTLFFKYSHPFDAFPLWKKMQM